MAASRVAGAGAPGKGGARRERTGVRISVLAGTLLPSRVASAVNILKMSRAFAAAGHEVTLYARGSQADAAEVFASFGLAPSFELVLLAPGGAPLAKNLLFPLAAARAIARRPAPDLLYGRHAYAMLAARRVARPAGRPLAPRLVYEAHVLTASRLRRLAEARLCADPRLALFVAISQALADDYRAALPILRRRAVLVAHDAADPIPPGVAPAEPWPGRSGAPQLGYVGHLYPGKGMELVAALARALPECDLHVVGGTEADLGRWRARCRGQPNLHLHGHVAHARVPGFLTRFDLLLAPPAPRVASAAGREIGRWMSPLKLFEYMAAGKPILASDIPALREILEDGRTALLLPPGEVAAWAAAARRLLADRAAAAALGAEALAALRETHSWDARAAKLLAALQASPR